MVKRELKSYRLDSFRFVDWAVFRRRSQIHGPLSIDVLLVEQYSMICCMDPENCLEWPSDL